MKVRIINFTTSPITTLYKIFRTCYSSKVWEDIETKSSKDMCDFIKEKMLKGHDSPLEHISVTFAISGLSRAALAQLTRHRTFKFAVQSQRYVSGEYFNFVVPAGLTDEQRDLFCMYSDIAKKGYQRLIEAGCPKEDARGVLTMNTTCELVVTCDMRNFRNFLGLRECSHAQTEIRELAFDMHRLVMDYIPFIGDNVLRCQKGLCSECTMTQQS